VTRISAAWPNGYAKPFGGPVEWLEVSSEMLNSRIKRILTMPDN
jgi:hypothetical protein